MEAGDARRFGFKHEVGEERDVHEGERLFGQKGAAGEHPRSHASGDKHSITNRAHAVAREEHAFKRPLPANTMEDKRLDAVLLGAGVLLVGQTFTDLAPDGPWSSASFTRGVLGLAGLLALYLVWFKQTFGVYGIAPTVDRWASPSTSWLNVVLFGLGCLVATRLIRLFDDGDVFPEPAGLLLALMGCMAVMNGGYVWLITNGPLNDEEE